MQSKLTTRAHYLLTTSGIQCSISDCVAWKSIILLQQCWCRGGDTVHVLTDMNEGKTDALLKWRSSRQLVAGADFVRQKAIVGIVLVPRSSRSERQWFIRRRRRRRRRRRPETISSQEVSDTLLAEKISEGTDRPFERFEWQLMFFFDGWQFLLLICSASEKCFSGKKNVSDIFAKPWRWKKSSISKGWKKLSREKNLVLSQRMTRMI